jgi:hypothetical protein
MGHSKKSVDQILKEMKKTAILAGRNWTELALRGFEEPVWKGVQTQKGVPRGFLLPKEKSALLMILYPTLSLRKIGELAGVDVTVLRVWRTKKDFKGEVRQACLDLATQAFRMAEHGIEGKSSPGLMLQLKGLGAPEHLIFAELLPFFNPQVSDFFFDYFDKKQEKQRRDIKEVGIFTLFSWGEFLRRYSRILFLRKDQCSKAWILKSGHISLLKKEISFLINFLASLAVHKIGTRGEIERLGAYLQKLISETIQNLSE